MGTLRTRPWRRHPPRVVDAAEVCARRGLSLLRYQLHPARPVGRAPQRPARRPVRPRPHLQTARHEEHALSALRAGLRTLRWRSVRPSTGPRRRAASVTPFAPRVRGAPVLSQTSLLPRTTTKAPSTPTPTSTSFFAAMSTTPPRAAWAESPGTPASSPTAHDVSVFAQALLDRLAGRPSDFPLKQSTLVLMTTPEQPGHSAQQLSDANAATPTCGRSPSPPTRCSLPPTPCDQGSEPPRLRLGRRHSILKATRPDLPHRQLRPHRLHRHHALDGSRLRHLLCPALQCHPSARQSTHLQPSAAKSQLQRRARYGSTVRRRSLIR